MSTQTLFVSGDWKESLMSALTGDGYAVFAPVKDGDITRFAPCSSSSAMDMDTVNTNYPLKEVFFPNTERLLTFRHSPGEETELATPPHDDQKIAVIGCRPCDASALGVLDAVFDWDYKDAFYDSRRKQSLIVTVGCARAAQTCFCTTVGLAPDATEGSDLLVQESDGGAIVTACSDKGGEFIQAHGDLFAAAPDNAAAVVADVPLREGVDVSVLKPWLDTHFEDDFWEELAMKCMGCGACSYLCPTCHCFDVVDEADWQGGERRRNYDFCSQSLFTRHASGHNPRPSQASRCRNRLMHKFSYFPERFGRLACVGCGRCLRVCGAGQNLVTLLRDASARAAAQSDTEEPA